MAIVRASLVLNSGCRVQIDFPGRGDSTASWEIYQKCQDRKGTFLGYRTEKVGPLDFRGLIPGVYVLHADDAAALVLVDGEQHPRQIKMNHLVVVDEDPAHVRISSNIPMVERIGELPNPVLFYQGDKVAQGEGPVLIVTDVYISPPFVGPDDPPAYQVCDFRDDPKRRNPWRVEGVNLRLLRRGSVGRLYDGEVPQFGSSADLLAFFARSGISKSVEFGCLPHLTLPGLSLKQAEDLFKEGDADIVLPLSTSIHESLGRFQVFQLFECWRANYLEYVRAATWAFLEQQKAAA